MYEPLKVTARPRVGIEADAFLPLDGILFSVAMRREYGPQMLTSPGRAPDARPVPLPLARVEAGGTWFYAASFAEWGPHADYSSFWVKRFDQAHDDLVDFDKRRGKVIVEEGRYKAYHMPTFLRHALWVSWYVVGDRGEIEALLAHATHLGKKATQGNGRIIDWRVEPWAEDWSVTGPDGRLMRALPAPDDPAAVLYGYRPSYWLPQNQTRCLLPYVG